MTNKEYITKSTNKLNLSEDDIDIIIAKSGLQEDENADFKACDSALYRQFSIVLKGMLKNVSMGGRSISWNIEAVKIFYNSLCAENGFMNVLNGITTARFL